MPKSISTSSQAPSSTSPAVLVLLVLATVTSAIILDKSTGFDGANIPLANAPPSVPLPAAVAASSVTSLAAVKAKAAPCKITEFKCENRRCVPLTRYCDNRNDCGDQSDEPRYCTRCNRTYYGEVGITYDLELHRPKEDRIPFVCYLTFKAAGDSYGDLVQLTFDSFTLGRFVSFTSDGCPDGYLQIIEAERPHVGGSWCGTSWGPSIYYSETDSVTITVSLLKLSKDQNGYNFDFRMEYKLLSKGDATVRYGGGTPFNPIYSTKSQSSHVRFYNLTTPSPTLYIQHQQHFNKEPRQPPTAVHASEYYLGDLITGTYCSRIFSDCDRRQCRLQSPNFPGVYPRNLTCYYAVRQHEVPPEKHAMITVRQAKGQLISIRSQAALYGTASTRELKVWNACDDVQDYVTVYDGYTTRDPVILKFCGGGEAVPEAVSSGHELLVEFSTSPYGTFLHPSPAQSLHGFQLEVEVRFVDLQSPTFVKNKRSCEFWIRGTGRGVLESPLHSIPANTSCLYHLQGMDTNPNIPHAASGPLPSSRYPPTYWRTSALVFPPARYRVWLSVVKFHVTTVQAETEMAGAGGTSNKEQHVKQQVCRSYLNVWDGQLWSPTNCNDIFCTKERSRGLGRIGAGGPTGTGGSSGKNVSLLARYCHEHVPRTCDHILLANATRRTRPCTLAESFLSSGDSLTLELRLSDSTALRPVRFRTLYEFVDLHLDGEAFGERPCHRRFSQSQGTAQKFHSPRDVFLFGRGGARNISCVYRFEAQPGEHVKLILSRVSLLTMHQRCQTFLNPILSSLQCDGNAAAASLRIYDVPQKDAPAYMRDCICGLPDKHLPYTYVSTSNVVEIRFNAREMGAGDDYANLSFEGTWQFTKMPSCAASGMRRMGASGEVAFVWPSENAHEVVCEKYPRAIIPQMPHKYLYVKTPGIILSQYSTVTGNRTRHATTDGCTTKNRVSIHTQLFTTYVCPYHRYSTKNLVEVFSDGWTRAKGGRPAVADQGIDYLGGELSRGVTIAFHVQEAGNYGVNWLELAHRKEIPHTEIGTIDHKQKSASSNGQSLGDDLLLHMQSTAECLYRCPELDACVNGSVWCDGVQDCPSGVDESIANCSLLLQLPPLYLILTLMGMFISAGVVVIGVYRGCVRGRLRRRKSFLQSRLHLSISSSTDTAILDEKSAAVIC